MKTRMALLAAVASVGMSTAAGAIQFVDDTRTVFQNQTAAGVTVGNTEVSFAATAPDGGTIASAYLQLPDGTTRIPLTVDPGGASASFTAFYPTEAATNAALPFGDYTHVLTLGSGITQRIVVDNPATIYTTVPAVTDFAALATLDPTVPVTIHTTPFVNQGYNRSGYFAIYDNGGPAVLDDSSLADLTAGSFTVPAGTLVAGHSYGFVLGWYSDVSFYRDGNTLISYEMQQTATSGAFTLRAAAVPEPATWAMLLTGFAGLGTALRRRRAYAAAR